MSDKDSIGSGPKFNVGDHVRLKIDFFKSINQHDIDIPDISERFGVIKSVQPNCFDGMSAIGPTPRYTHKYCIKMDHDGMQFNAVPQRYLISAPFNFTRPMPLNYDVFKLEAEAEVTNPNMRLNHNPMILNAINGSPGIIKFELEKENKMNTNVRIPEIDKVIFNDPATIIYWKAYHTEEKESEDKITGAKTKKHVTVQDKTIVKCAPGETFNKYNGFCAAVAKYIFETNSAIHRIVENAQDDSAKKNNKPMTEKIVLKSRDECKYYRNKCGRKVTCKQVTNCVGKFNPDCSIRKTNEGESSSSKKTTKKGGKKK